MKAIVVTRQGAPVAPNIELRDWPEPGAPKPGWATVRTLATAFNHMDLWVGKGVPGLDLDYPRISGCDACGIVEAVGDGVDPSWIGTRVIANAATRLPESARPGVAHTSIDAPIYELIGEHHHGMLAQAFQVPVDNLAPVADDRDPVEAAAFGLCALTAWSMMITKGDLRPGQDVLVTGIGGGVATSALAIAKWRGCRVCVTSRHHWKLDRALELGADHAILDDGADFSRAVRAWTH
ncbi:MAG: alcohol dehydrogenase catalytic domain-containing protein, partial [Phycisphaerales bacterium]|nr:alcohol dehydrogenase catalytic domain-containing protein [Phycisphaerales bacterium]